MCLPIFSLHLTAKIFINTMQCRAPLKRGSRHCLPLVERSPDSVTAVGGDDGDNTNNNPFYPPHFCGSVSVKTRLASQKIYYNCVHIKHFELTPHLRTSRAEPRRPHYQTWRGSCNMVTRSVGRSWDVIRG